MTTPGRRRRRPAWPNVVGVIATGMGRLPVFALPALLLVVQVVFTTLAARNQPDRAALDLLGYALLAAGPLALLLRRRYPLAVLVVVASVTVTYVAIGYPYGPIFASTFVAFVSAVLRGHRRGPWALAALAVVAHGVLQVSSGERVTWVYLAGAAAWLTAALALAELIRVRRERAAEAERMRAGEARRRAGEERLRIARDLHDVLAHHISLINIQAGVALHLLDADIDADIGASLAGPAQVREALAIIKQESRDVLHELRSALDVLRGSDETAPKAPTPGLDRLDELVERSQAAGITVHTVVEGRSRPLPASVDTAAFRIVQEALTNVYRHARADNATVLVGYGEQALTVQVDDDGTGSPAGASDTAAGSGGRGLAGMRERAAALGGGLDAGRRPDGGFRVRATLPLDGARPGAGAG